VTRVLALNTLAGFAFGILFWRYGLEHAMLAHFATDIVLHAVVGGHASALGSKSY
jgi:membrane protease YdiL (CAAX protease family)